MNKYEFFEALASHNNECDFDEYNDYVEEIFVNEHDSQYNNVAMVVSSSDGDTAEISLDRVQSLYSIVGPESAKDVKVYSSTAEYYVGGRDDGIAIVLEFKVPRPSGVTEE